MNSILIIDDEEVDYLIHSKVIKKGNFAEKVIYYNSGESALSYLQTILGNSAEWPTHIFLDINMPGMNGFQFIEKYNQLANVPSLNTKIYIVSSSANPVDQVKAKNYSIVKDYLIKPLTIQTAERIFNENA